MKDKSKNTMKLKTYSICALFVIMATGVAVTATSCNSNRYVTYEDGMFDENEASLDEASDIFQLNSEIDNDDTERY